MSRARSDSRGWLNAALVCSGLLGAQAAAAAATRDTLFLTTMDAAARPAMVAASAGLSVLLGLLHWQTVRRASTSLVAPAWLVVNSLLLLLNWRLAASFPAAGAQAFFLQTNALGPLLGLGFWQLMSERIDPRTAKTSFGRIASAATLVGLAGALAAGAVSNAFGVAAMLPVLALLSLASAWRMRRLADALGGPRARDDDDARAASPEVLRASDAITLALVILLGAISATLVEHLMNVQADAALPPESLPGFFSAYYAGISVLVFTVQAAFVSRAFSALGLGLAMSSPSLALGAAGVGALVFPGLLLVTVAYGSMSVLYESLFRPAKDVFFTPVPREEQRIKLFVDVAPNRLGAAIAAGLTLLVSIWWIERLYPVLLLTAIACAGAAAVLAARLTRANLGNLGRALVRHGARLDPGDGQDITTRTAMLRTIRSPGAPASAVPTAGPFAAVSNVAVVDAELGEVQALRSGDTERILAVLRDPAGVGGLIQQVIPLLAVDHLSDDAVKALRMVAEEHVGALVDALLDLNQPFAVRRRLARVFSVCASQRAADGLLLGLDDLRFEVRFQCGRSLASILQRNPRVRIERERVLDVVWREIAVGRAVWENHQLLEGTNSGERTFVDEFLKDRAGQGLAHVFTLLSLVLPAEPLQIAYRGLHTTDERLRGTALEYLEGVVPAGIYDRLSPFLGVTRPATGAKRSRDEILADLLRSNDQITLNLEELRRRART